MLKIKRLSKKTLKIISVISTLIIVSAICGYLYILNSSGIQTTEKNTPQAFISEVYNTIKENYWQNIPDEKLKDMFKTATEKNGGQVNAANAAAIAQTVLSQLPPIGRSSLYTQKQEVILKNTVENRNPETGKVEPTILTKIYPGGVLYVQFNRFSPTSLDEFQKAFDSNNNNDQLDSLILDLRGNIGGAIDSTAYFLGFFLGKNQSAFEFFHKGQYIPFTTPTEKLLSLQKYKQIVVLIDQNTQSSAEMMAASFKSHKIGLVVGTTSKGWGSVERVFPLENQFNPQEKYSIFLVHSLTVRDDKQPIEGKGVEPNIDIRNSNWESQFPNEYKNSVSTVKKILISE